MLPYETARHSLPWDNKAGVIDTSVALQLPKTTGVIKRVTYEWRSDSTVVYRSDYSELETRHGPDTNSAVRGL